MILTIHKEMEDFEHAAEVLRKIAQLVEQGYTSGVDPTWEIKADDAEAGEKQ